MRRLISISLLLLVILSAIFGVVAVAQVPATKKAGKPLSEAEVMEGLTGGVSNKRLAALVGQYGVDFSLSPKSEGRLRAVGADDGLLEAIRNATPKAATLLISVNAVCSVDVNGSVFLMKAGEKQKVEGIVGDNLIQATRNGESVVAWQTVVTLQASEEKIVLVELPALPPPTPKPSIAVFESGSDTLERGHSTKLTWATQNATEVSIDQGVGTVDANGSREVRPNENTTYTLTAKGQGGSDTKSVQIAVLAPAPVPAPVTSPATGSGTEPDNPAKAVRETIEVRYKEAYQSMVIGDLEAVWPTMTKQQKNAISGLFKVYKAIKADYSCSQPAISGDTARCTCTESVTYTTSDNKRQAPMSASFVFELKRTSGNWFVQNRSAQ